ncbi:salivary protein KUN-5, putative [Ixodes scapularis]|uniref:Salivary protein KUN-5, putative n=1 Tax=Ixodes scapularis TaxID=6945 RepID=B7QJS7_IXOSC|nr:salivary protein KUN-5, putative [Ixodes scapularis]|eukprot:XP_002415434.1 salivary protein KUN-5, putative [Ixodes scapularis]
MQPTMQFIFVMSFVVLVGHALVKEGQKRCTEVMDEGPCRALIPRYFYNMTTEKCETFDYGGCYGNNNNFFDENSCTSTCEGVSKMDMCEFASKKDECRETSDRFFFDKETKKCKKVKANKCLKRQNYFWNKETCESLCKSKSALLKALFKKTCSPFVFITAKVKY